MTTLHPFVPLRDNRFQVITMKFCPFVLCSALSLVVSGCGMPEPDAAGSGPNAAKPLALNPDISPVPASAAVATFGAGCFWCVEEVLHQTPGVLSAVSGYMGGSARDANYESVGRGATDHAEVVQVHFDPETVSYDELLRAFFRLHDPAQLNRQGPDQGRQYRSVIFYYDDSQKEAAARIIQDLTESKAYGDRPIVTEVVEAIPFYEAESYHQNFARLNPGNDYLKNYLYPKLKKFGMRNPQGSEPGETKKPLPLRSGPNGSGSR